MKNRLPKTTAKTFPVIRPDLLDRLAQTADLLSDPKAQPIVQEQGPAPKLAA